MKKKWYIRTQQAFDGWKLVWEPAVFATEVVEIVIFRSLINKHWWDIIGHSESKSYNSITPIEIITVTVDDLPEYILLKSTL